MGTVFKGICVEPAGNCGVCIELGFTGMPLVNEAVIMIMELLLYKHV